MANVTRPLDEARHVEGQGRRAPSDLEVQAVSPTVPNWFAGHRPDVRVAGRVEADGRLRAESVKLAACEAFGSAVVARI